MKIQKVGVLGGGLMGSGIAQVCAGAGYSTIVREVSDVLCQKARANIDKTLSKGMEKGKVTAEQRTDTLGRLSFVTDVSALRDCDIVIEAVV